MSVINQRRVLLDEVERLLERAQERQKCDKREMAGQDYRLAAARLMDLAEMTASPELRQQRVEQANHLLSLARDCKAKAPVKTQNRVREGADSRESDERKRFEPATPSQRVRFSDVDGLEELKEEIRLRMIEPFAYPQLAREVGLKPGGGVLFYGPPGTGKTLMARAVAGEVDAAFFSVKASDVMSKWVGESEQRIRELFEEANGRERAVVYIDEIDALVPRRQDNGSTIMARVVPQFLAEMDGFDKKSESSVMVIGSTNEPWSIEPAMLRPGRFDVQIYVGLPDYLARVKLLQRVLSSRPVEELDYYALAEQCEGMSGADINELGNRMARRAFRKRQADPDWMITMDDIETELASQPRSVSNKMLQRFNKWQREMAVERSGL